MDFWSLLINDWDIKLLIFARVIGIFAYNPILSRQNVPTRVKIGACALIALITAMVIGQQPIDVENIRTGVYVLLILKEGFVGLVLGFITNMFFYTIQLGGEIMDMQAGLGMAKVFDPGTKIQMSIFGSIIVFMMYLYFFVTNAHLTYIKLFVVSYQMIPLGTGSINPDIGMIIVQYFSVVLMLVVKLAMPIIAAELILQFCIGILMKSVPQIQIMIINIQLKVAVGFMLLYLIAVPVSHFVDNYMAVWLETLEGIIPRIMS